MYFIHAPEIHFSPSKAKECLYALEEMYFHIAGIRARQVVSHDQSNIYVFFTGDLYDHAMQNTDRSGFVALHKALEKIASIAFVIYQYGTRSKHDMEGSYEVLRIYDRSEVLSVNNRTFANDEISVFSFEEPQMSEFRGESVEEIWSNIQAHEKKLCLMAAEFFRENPGKRHILIGHGAVLCDATVNNPAVVFGNYHVSETELAETGADIALWGHLHQPYIFSKLRGGYTRSLAHNYSDCGFLPGFSVYDDSYEESVIRLKELPARFGINVNIPDDGDPVIELNKQAVALLSSGEKVAIRPDVSIPHDINDSTHRNQISELILSKYPGVVLDAPRIIERTGSKVRNADIANDTSYRALCKKVYPDWDEEDLLEMDKLEEEDIKEGIIPVKKEISLKSISARGYIPLKNGIGSDEFRVDFDQYGRCVLGLVAPGGFGKSSTGDLVFPHPECLSQPESKANLFFLQDSYIINKFDVDGHDVECKIIGGPEGKGAAYFCYVDGQEKCKKGVREYKEVVNSIFGTIHEFALVMSRTQFKFARVVDGANCNPDIKYAANKEMKDLYAPLCGSDKTKTMLRCKARADEFKKTYERLEHEISGIRSSIDNLVTSTGDINLLTDELIEKEDDLSVIREGLEIIICNGKDAAANIESARSASKKNEAEKEKRRTDITKMSELSVKAEECSGKIKALSEKSQKLESNKKLIAEDDQRIEFNSSNESSGVRNSELRNKYDAELNAWNTKLSSVRTEVSSRNDALMAKFRAESSKALEEHSALVRKYNSDLSEWNAELERVQSEARKKNTYEAKKYEDAIRIYRQAKQSAEMSINESEHKISVNSSSCPNCGYISPDAKKIIEDEARNIEAKRSELASLFEPVAPSEVIVPATLDRPKPLPVAEYVAPAEPVLEPIPESIEDPKPSEPQYEPVAQAIPASIDRASVLREIEEASGASSSIATLEDLRTSINDQIDELQSRRYDIDESAEEKLRMAEAEKSRLETLYLSKMSESKSMESSVSSIKEKIAAAKQSEDSLNALKKNMSDKSLEKESAETLHLRWKKYQAAWDRNGIPARFVELAAPMIDSMANEILSQFYPDMFIETCTTKEDSNGETADTFEVMVYNTREGTKQKLSSLSGEQTNFVLSAMFFAFRKKYEENTGRKINFVFEDEQDDHVSLLMQPAYWNMVQYQQQLENKLRICTSHSAEFPNRIENVIDLEAMK